ncbi:MAG TPA: NAD-dependent epimerase/dehydratase family protein [Pelagibacterium sp.]|uniref:NAD-dependent epimerase/dehydratase family protein n=1 Tax=Pelagibacterium sp. TaxID=1967288 RepID=UPI002BD1A90E|nr:NAD-dependent epimerase/dehydratase family protein [Pelagibacterium sp.]HWJ86731.1 NAD-dependent epimerase/dehydratase family protein [Pelagibacterium sp.]
MDTRHTAHTARPGAGHPGRPTALVCGAAGFIGSHLVARLRHEGFWVRGVDLEPPAPGSEANEFALGDLRDPGFARAVVDRPFDEVYQLAADMGGAGYIFTGANDAAILHNSALINLNVLDACRARSVSRIFYSSSACIYPARNQTDPNAPHCAEDSAYPADPDSDYGWEKLFSERLYLAYRRNHGIKTRIGRYHNIFGPGGAWQGGREKAPAALCRKVALAETGSAIEVWGDGQQTRSFLFIQDCLDATTRLMRSDCALPLNIGSQEMITINDLARLAIALSGKTLTITNISGPQGVRGRTSDNRLIGEVLGWSPAWTLRRGMEQTYGWIADRVAAQRHPTAA